MNLEIIKFSVPLHVVVTLIINKKTNSVKNNVLLVLANVLVLKFNFIHSICKLYVYYLIITVDLLCCF